MTKTIRLFAALLTLSSSILSTPTTALALEGRARFWERPTYRVASNSSTSFGSQFRQRFHQPEPELMAAAPAPAPTYAAVPSGDPYGFVNVLNQYRAMAGLGPVSYDSSLAAWASQNNAAQSRRGLGHHINPNCFQNCGWNYSDVWSVARGWMNSPGHRANMLSPSISRIGVAYGPGPYWTMNAL